MKEIDGIGIKLPRNEKGDQVGITIVLYSGKYATEYKLSKKIARDLMRAIYRAIGTRTYGPP